MNPREEKEQRSALRSSQLKPQTVGLLGGFEGLPYFGFFRNRSAKDLEIDFRRNTSHVTPEVMHEIEQRWRVRASGRLGLPTRQDQDVYVAVVQILQERGMPEDGILWVSVYELVRILGWQESRASYDRVRRSLDRIGSTSIRSDNAFWSTRSNSYVSDTFSLWTYHTAFYQEALSGKHVKGHRLDFHRLFIENYLDNDLNQIDIEFYWSLKDHMAKRLYRLIEHYAVAQKSTQRQWDVDLFLLRDLMPLANYRHASQIKRAVSGAIAELSALGYLAKAEDRREPDGGYRVTYTVSARFARKRVQEAVEYAPENQAALEMMKRAEIPRDVRLRVLQKYDAELCLKFAALLPHQKNVKNLVKAFQWALKHPEEANWWEDVADATGDCSRIIEDLNNTGGEVEGPERKDDGEEATTEPGPEPRPDPDALSLWNKMLDGAEDGIEASTLKVWFEGTVPTHLENGILTISVPNSFAQEYIEGRFRALLEEALHNHLSPAAELVVEVHGE